MRILDCSRATFIVAAAMLITAVSSPASAGLFDLFAPTARPNQGRTLVVFPSKLTPGTILVSFRDRRLYYVLPAQRAIAYPIGAPTGDARWSGTTQVSAKKINPGWTPTGEMRRKNPALPAFVPGGHPRNPLGVRALYLGSSTYRIHGTDAPWTVGQDVSRGCIRMFNDDVIDLYQRVPIGTQVLVTW